MCQPDKHRLNLGDEAILRVIVSQFRDLGAKEITVFSRDVAETRRLHAADQVVPLVGLSRREAQQAVARLDLLILGGGGILYDTDADMYLRWVETAHEARTPVMVYAVSAGPLSDPAVRARVRDALDTAAIITVRDRHSQQLLEGLGIRREVQAAFSLSRGLLPRQVRNTPRHLGDFQRMLGSNLGFVLAWPNPRATAR